MKLDRLVFVGGLLLGFATGQRTATAAPDVARKLKAEGDGLIQGGKPKEALAAYEKAIKEDADFLAAHAAIAASLLAEKKFPEVVARLAPVVAKHPDWAQGHYTLAYAHRKAGQFGPSVEAYKKFLGLRKDDAEAHYGLGKSLLGLGKKDEAVASFTTYVRLEKRQSEKQWVEKAKAEIARLRKKGASAPAVVEAESGDATAPDERTPSARAAALCDEADALAKDGKWAEAWALYVAAHEADTNSMRAFDGMGAAGVKAGKARDMVGMFRSATADHPTYAAGYLYLGRSLAAAGEKDDALAALKHIVALAPTNPDGQYELGMLAHEMGKKPEATQALKKYLEVENRPGADHDAMKATARATLEGKPVGAGEQADKGGKAGKPGKSGKAGKPAKK